MVAPLGRMALNGGWSDWPRSSGVATPIRGAGEGANKTTGNECTHPHTQIQPTRHARARGGGRRWWPGRGAVGGSRGARGDRTADGPPPPPRSTQLLPPNPNPHTPCASLPHSCPPSAVSTCAAVCPGTSARGVESSTRRWPFV